jgi:fumarylacetoacetase
MLRGAENALPVNWTHMPIGYNGRASTVVVSGTPIRRPWGQSRPVGATDPVFTPSRRLDFELEMGVVVGVPTEMGQTLTVAQAQEHIFGYVLLNDWSARDIQGWESQPLGPFQGKAFGTSISPWVVMQAALEPFRTPMPAREKPLLPYLGDAEATLYDIALEAELRPASQQRGTVITRSNFSNLYFSPAQLLAHHACGGCRMETGDLLGTGTISGVEREAWASLLELSMGGKEALVLETGESRHYLEDGDTLTIRAHAGKGDLRIGFGACTGTILPAWPPRDAR